eukprot:SAG11_NODE_2100_length_3826_cov_40.900456_4_plen_157_part_00
MINARRRDGDTHHITLLAPHELKAARARDRDEPRRLLASAQVQLGAALAGIQLLGLGSAAARFGPERCWYCVVEWDAAAAWRTSLGLPPFDFHLTLGFDGRDVHGVRHDYMSCATADISPHPYSYGPTYPALAGIYRRCLCGAPQPHRTLTYLNIY